jgi:DNA adenine methylase
MADPSKILSELFSYAISQDYKQIQVDPEILEKIVYVCECISNRAGVRLLMSCLLAKVHNHDLDPTKPYTEIGSDDCFSGRTYD